MVHLPFPAATGRSACFHCGNLRAEPSGAVPVAGQFRHGSMGVDDRGRRHRSSPPDHGPGRQPRPCRRRVTSGSTSCPRPHPAWTRSVPRRGSLRGLTLRQLWLLAGDEGVTEIGDRLGHAGHQPGHLADVGRPAATRPMMASAPGQALVGQETRAGSSSGTARSGPEVDQARPMHRLLPSRRPCRTTCRGIPVRGTAAGLVRRRGSASRIRSRVAPPVHKPGPARPRPPRSTNIVTASAMTTSKARRRRRARRCRPV